MIIIEDHNSIEEARVHFTALNNLLNKAKDEFVHETTELGFFALRNNIPKDTGKTARRIRKETESGVDEFGRFKRGKVHIPPNGQEDSRVPSWLHHGTGVWGPIGRPYFPIKGEFMTFVYKKKLFRLTEVRGQRRSGYWDKTIDTTEAFATIKAYTLFREIF